MIYINSKTLKFAAFILFSLSFWLVSPVYSAEQIFDNTKSEVNSSSNQYQSDSNLGSQILNPNDANAGFVEGITRGAVTAKQLYSAYKAYSKVTSDDADRNFWVVALNKEILDGATMALCDKYQEEVLNEENGCSNDRYEGIAMRREGGLMQMASSVVVSTVNEPPIPTDLALFINDTADDTIFGTPAYAQGPMNSAPFRTLTYSIWKYMRNIALLLIGVLVAVGGFMIMFRTKLAPQVTVSLYNVLPIIPVVLVLIVISYPLVAIIQSAMLPLVGIVVNILFGIASDVGITNLSTPGEVFMDSMRTGVNSVFDAIAEFGVYTFALALIAIGALIGILVALISVIINIVKIIIDLFIIACFSPIAFAVAVIPGKSGIIMHLLKKLIVNIISLPISLFFVGFGFIVLAIPLEAVSNEGFFGLPPIWFGMAMMAMILKYAIGVGIIFYAFKVRGTLMESFGATGGIFSDGQKPRR